MIDTKKRQEKNQEKEKVRRRMRVEIDPENYEYIPAKKPIDYYDNEVPQRVAIYVRVSTDDVRQTTSYELQKKYYEDFVRRHPNWSLVKIYADEGISGTSLKHRDAFNEMIEHCRAGKIDLISGSVMYTKERAERVIFPETPLYSLPVSVMVRNEQRTATGFLATLEESFEKTLIREDRYKMILGGLKVTLILAVGSLICGTMLGFFFCLLKRSKNRLISTLMNAFIALMAGLPIVLTLMICFYIIFSGTGLNEIIVAIIAFSVDFGCYTAITLNSGIESVPHGEIEAAEALGLSKLQIYRRIILPQAIQKVFGVYTRQVVSLIKSTSIVGYIAVQDLTKVSDIIRARTYEAFFSLIFTAAIYFLIARICIYLLHSVEHAFNRRKSKQIML